MNKRKKTFINFIFTVLIFSAVTRHATSRELTTWKRSQKQALEENQSSTVKENLRTNDEEIVKLSTTLNGIAYLDNIPKLMDGIQNENFNENNKAGFDKMSTKDEDDTKIFALVAKRAIENNFTNAGTTVELKLNLSLKQESTTNDGIQGRNTLSDNVDNSSINSLNEQSPNLNLSEITNTEKSLNAVITLQNLSNIKLNNQLQIYENQQQPTNLLDNFLDKVKDVQTKIVNTSEEVKKKILRRDNVQNNDMSEDSFDSFMERFFKTNRPIVKSIHLLFLTHLPSNFQQQINSEDKTKKEFNLQTTTNDDSDKTNLASTDHKMDNNDNPDAIKIIHIRDLPLTPEKKEDSMATSEDNQHVNMFDHLRHVKDFLQNESTTLTKNKNDQKWVESNVLDFNRNKRNDYYEDIDDKVKKNAKETTKETSETSSVCQSEESTTINQKEKKGNITDISNASAVLLQKSHFWSITVPAVL